MLSGVVQTGGTTSRPCRFRRTRVERAGTANEPDGHGGYSKTAYDATFVGMVPASKPRLVVLVKVDDPHGAIYGGTVAAPAFQSIAKFDLQYLAVPPDDPRTALSAQRRHGRRSGPTEGDRVIWRPSTRRRADVRLEPERVVDRRKAETEADPRRRLEDFAFREARVAQPLDVGVGCGLFGSATNFSGHADSTPRVPGLESSPGSRHGGVAAVGRISEAPRPMRAGEVESLSFEAVATTRTATRASGVDSAGRSARSFADRLQRRDASTTPARSSA